MLTEIQDAVAKAGQVVREAVGGLQTVRSFGAEEQEVSRYEEALERCRQLWWRRDLEKAVYLVIRRVRRLWRKRGMRSQTTEVLGTRVAHRGAGGAHSSLPSSLQMMALGMQVLILNCGVQQILAGEVTRGGLLSFLLYQEEVGHHVQVSEMSSGQALAFFLDLWAMNFIGLTNKLVNNLMDNFEHAIRRHYNVFSNNYYQL